MKILKTIFSLLFLVSLGNTIAAQTIFQETGDLKMLAAGGTLMVKYDYSTIEMGDGTPEATYLQSKREELNAKRPNRGDEFVERWERNKKERWELKFEELFNKYGGKLQLSQQAKDAQYTLTVKTIVTFPGLSTGAGFGGVPSYISCEMYITETAKPGIILSKTLVKHVVGPTNCGMFVDDPGLCLQEAYAKMAKVYADHIKKNKK